MNKCYSLLVGALLLCSTALFAQPSCDPADAAQVNFGSALSTDINGMVYDGGTTAEACGLTDSGPVAFSYGNSNGAVAVATLWRFDADQSTWVSEGALTDGQLLFLFSDAVYGITLQFDEPVEDETFTLSYATPGNNQAAVATVLGLPLPVEFASLAARGTAKSVELDWSTASESGNSGFEVQRSGDGDAWHKLAFVTTAYDGNVGGSYDFIDENPLNGTSYYRLKQIDFDGRSDYSRVLEMNFTSENPLQVYPNPAVESINVRLAESTDNVYRAVITDRVGRTVLERTVSGTDAINLADLEAGVYQVSIMTEEGVVTQRFVKN